MGVRALKTIGYTMPRVLSCLAHWEEDLAEVAVAEVWKWARANQGMLLNAIRTEYPNPERWFKYCGMCPDAEQRALLHGDHDIGYFVEPSQMKIVGEDERAVDIIMPMTQPDWRRYDDTIDHYDERSGTRGEGDRVSVITPLEPCPFDSVLVRVGARRTYDGVTKNDGWPFVRALRMVEEGSTEWRPMVPMGVVSLLLYCGIPTEEIAELLDRARPMVATLWG